MEKIIKKYSITVEGNDLDAKAVQKLKAGEELKIGRITDGEDTYEISVSTAGDKMLDLLAYCDSIGIAPFIDDGSVTVESCKVDKVILKQGKSRAKDKTTLYFDVEYGYDSENLAPYTTESGIMGFIPNDDVVLAMAIYKVLDGGDDMIMEQPYLNMYDMEMAISKKQKELFGVEFEEDKKYSFYCRVLFDEAFSKCKVAAYVKEGEESLEIPLEENEKQTALTLVNHRRIFAGDTPVDCVIE